MTEEEQVLAVLRGCDVEIVAGVLERNLLRPCPLCWSDDPSILRIERGYDGVRKVFGLRPGVALVRCKDRPDTTVHVTAKASS